MEDPQKSRKIKVSYLDPDATDSSSDEDEQDGGARNKISKRKIHEIIVGIKEKHTQILVSSPEGIIQTGIGKRSTSCSYVGVHRRRSGRYSSEIKDPFTKKRVWLGTFNTAEEAHLVYMSKKIEIQERLIARAKHGLISSRGRASAAKQDDHTATTSELSNNSGSFEENNNNKGEAAAAAAAASSSSEEEERFGFLCGVQVVDRNGFLVGEFSKLDDLSICSEDGTTFWENLTKSNLTKSHPIT